MEQGTSVGIDWRLIKGYFDCVSCENKSENVILPDACYPKAVEAGRCGSYGRDMVRYARGGELTIFDRDST